MDVTAFAIEVFKKIVLIDLAGHPTGPSRKSPDIRNDLSLSRPVPAKRAAQIDRVRAEQIRILVQNCPAGVIGATCGAATLAVALVITARCDGVLAGVWIAAMVGCAVLHIGLCIVHRRRRPPDTEWRRWLWPFTVIAALEGLIWFIGAFWMTSATNVTQELVVLLVSSAIASGAVPVFGTYLPTYLVFFFPAIAPHLWFAFAYDYPFHLALIVLLLAYLLFMTLITNHSNRQLVEGLLLRFENADLLDALQHQTVAAVRANEEKSRFLAAASHDLRQPIHALGLFLGALRAHPQADDAARLIDDMNTSLAAMDDLFSSLLDISKLDAGVVEARQLAVPLAPMMSRLCREYGTLAEAKNLRFDVVMTRAVVRSDPVLLERVLRNLLSNAVRYTDRGHILIGCRSRKDGVVLELWDTGVGIAAADLEMVFHEFHQIGNPERDRSKGLGLGLAIVRRVAALIDADVTVSSRIGKGSVFRVRLPRWTGPVEIGEVVSSEIAPPQIDGLVVVIDDEREIRQAMTALLASWDIRCLAVATADEAILALGRDAATPALLICDYRLRTGLTGVDAINTLRAAFRHPIPALLVTGDTAPERLEEISASDFPVLHKPVRHARLRAAIGNLTRASGARRT